MRNLNLSRVVLSGLGLGSLAGLIESGFILQGLGVPGDFSNLAIIEIALWGMTGVIAAVFSYLFSRTPELEFDILNARIIMRTLLLLLFIELGAQINFQFLPGLLHWKSITFNIVLISVMVSGWRVSARFSSSNYLRWLLSIAPIIWCLVIAISLVTATIITINSGSHRQAVISVFHGRQIDEPNNGTPPRVAVLGIDSATWSILEPQIERGSLPNLAGLMRNGTWGTLTSYEYSASPVVWTSIFTGKPPEKHGITDFPVAIASNRKVKALWQIAEEHGFSSAVINVPGTYPVLDDCDVMLAGFPLPTASYTNRGWFLTTGSGAINRIVPSINLGLKPENLSPGETWTTEITLKDLPPSFPSGKSAHALLLQRLISVQFSRNAQMRLVAVDYGTLNLCIASDDKGRIEVSLSSREPLCSLREGEWSDWLEIKIRDSLYSAKIHFIKTDDSEISLYITPFYPFPGPLSVKPAKWINSNLAAPYIAEGVGWQIFLEDRLLDTLPQHLTDVGRCRKSIGLKILEQMDHDLFIYIITMTDRIQHPMLKFMMPEAYRKLANELKGDFSRFQPTSEEIAEHGGVINRTYEVADKWLGEFLERLDPETMVFVISDHGATPGIHYISPTAGIHDPAGIYIIARAGEKSGNTAIADNHGPVLALEDITPIVLHTLGLPVAGDMGKTFPEFLLEETGRQPEIVQSYESVAQGVNETPEKVDAAIQEQLRSLGYLQ